MREPLRIAILECDTPIGNVRQKYGGYGNLFKELLELGAKELAVSELGHPPQLHITKYDVVNHEVFPDLADVDAILLTGSKFNAYDNDPWILKLVECTRSVLAQRRVRLIGVCFGHQIIGRAMDAKVDRSDKGWETSVTKVKLTEKGKALLGLEEMNIHQMHRDIVYEFPPGTESLGSTDRCEVQGLYAKNRLISVQGHPEFDGAYMTELLEARHNMGIFDDAQYKDGIGRVEQPHDGVQISAAFLRFLLEE